MISRTSGQGLFKLLSVVGARPQFIKAAALNRQLRQAETGGNIVDILLHTGQHYDKNMSKVFFEQLDIPEPDYNLGVGSGPHGQQTARMLEGTERVLLKERPDLCVVYGDTNSTLAGALAAAKLGIPVAHVEAGLRSYNRAMPEETNRVLTDHVSDLLFCPTQTAVDNLAKEGIVNGVHLVGDVMYDCLLYYRPKARAIAQSTLCSLGLSSKGYVLATIHRAENTSDRTNLAGILEGLDQVCRLWPVVLPLHPRTVRFIAGHVLQTSQQIKVVEPVPYLQMLALQENALLIITDSGGVQKEAYWLGVPCVTVRQQTEWVETVQTGWNCLAGSDPDRIIQAAKDMISGQAVRQRPTGYGTGDAARRIKAIILDWCG